MTSVVEFSKDESSYVQWITAHRDGFVLNKVGRAILMLHTAKCPYINDFGKNLTTKGRKVCSTDRAALEAWCYSAAGRIRGRKPDVCGKCKP